MGAFELFETRRHGVGYAIVPGTEGAEGSRSRRICKVVFTISMVLVVTVGTVIFCRIYLGPVLKWLMELGGWEGPTLYGGLIVISAIPPMWGYMVLNVGAGYIYGIINGTILTSAFALIGSLLAVLLCRYCLKSQADRLLKSWSNLEKLAQLMEGDQGLKIVMMTRLTPVPFGIQNALFAASDITLMRFATATFLALLPTQILNSYLGTTLRSLDEVVKGNSNAGMMILQIVMMVWVTWYVNRRMKREMALAMERDAASRQMRTIHPSQSHDLLESLVSREARGAVETPLESENADMLESWVPFDIGLDEDYEDRVTETTFAGSKSIEANRGRSSLSMSVFSESGDNFDLSDGMNVPTSSTVRQNSRSQSADIGLRFGAVHGR